MQCLNFLLITYNGYRIGRNKIKEEIDHFVFTGVDYQASTLIELISSNLFLGGLRCDEGHLTLHLP